MTMHLVRGLSSINSRKRKQKRKAGWQEVQAKHDAWLMKNGVHPSQLKNQKKSNGKSIPNYSTTCDSVKTSDIITPVQGKSRQNEYSGEYIIGLATLHKSNTVPVGRGDNPEIYAKMRRG